MKKLFMLGLALLITGSGLFAQKNVRLKNEADSISYVMGVLMGESFKDPQAQAVRKALQPQLFTGAFLAASADEPVRITYQEAVEYFQQYMTRSIEQASEENRKAGEEFLTENAKQPGVTVTESGLQYRVEREGQGPKPGPDDPARMHYRGKLIDGTEFDNSYDRDEPLEVRSSQVIPGFGEGMQLMSPGAKYTFYIPSDLGYGPSGQSSIPPNSVLVFEVEMLDFVPADDTSAEAEP